MWTESPNLELGQAAGCFVRGNELPGPTKGREGFCYLTTGKLLKGFAPWTWSYRLQRTRVLATAFCSGMIVCKSINLITVTVVSQGSTVDTVTRLQAGK